MHADGLLARLTVSKQGQMKAIWGETKSQEVTVHFSGISFVRMYGEHMRSRTWAAAVNFYNGDKMKLFLFVFKIKGMHWFIFFLSVLFLSHVVRKVLLLQIVISANLFRVLVCYFHTNALLFVKG